MRFFSLVTTTNKFKMTKHYDNFIYKGKRYSIVMSEKLISLSGLLSSIYNDERYSSDEDVDSLFWNVAEDFIIDGIFIG